MNYSWKIVRTIMAVVGGLLVFGAVGTVDYYTLEMGQHEPSSAWTTIIVGLLLMLPTLIHLIYQTIKEKNNENYLQS